MKIFLAVLLASVLLVACSATGRHKVLSVLFDGVPEPEVEEAPLPPPAAPSPTKAAIKAPAPPEPSAAELAAGGYAALDELPLRAVPRVTGEVWQSSDAPLEQAATWQEALGMLPLDAVGGVDWVAAVEEGLAVPKLVLDVDATAPFTLDNLVGGGAAAPGSPFLDFTLEMTPDDNPYFKVEFPHSSHTLFLACSSCHPGVREWDVPMERILAGQACGQCHGKVSFDLETGCPRCHQSLTPPTDEAVENELTAARAGAVPASPELVARGAELYRRYCAFCHGDDGGGAGRLAPYLTTKPRNFQAGTYKFRSTLGPLPTDLDLFRTITRGVPGTSMPGWTGLASEDRWALVHYVKTFSDYFLEEKPGEVLAISEPPAASDELLAQGKRLFAEVGCNSCHGDQGRGDGPSARSLRDNWGEPIRPYNFASGRPMKSGSGSEDVFRVVMTGIGGTPMPAFGQSLTEQQAWSLVRYVETFKGEAREPFAVKGDILFPRPAGTNGNGTPQAAADAGGGDGDFWGVGDAEASADDGGGEDDFWGVGDEQADTAVAAGDDDFWGVEEESSGGDDDFWDDEEEGTGDDDFWGDEGGTASPPATAGVVAPAPEPELPPAHFPHWFHRIRLKCANCHPRVFEMKKGSNPITMDAMRAGLYCAKCHNGKIAWEIAFTACPKCHQANPGS